MPAPIPTPTGVIRFRMFFDLNDVTPWSSKFDLYYIGTPPSSAVLNYYAGQVASNFAGEVVGLLSVNWTMVEVTAVDLANPTTIEGSATADVTGTRPGTNLDSGRCTCIVFRPDRRYRGGRPKAFLPFGVREDYGTDQTWAAAYVTEAEAGWIAFMAVLNGVSDGGSTLKTQAAVFYNGPPYTVVTNAGKTKSHSVPTPLDPPEVYNVNSIYVTPKLASQRRRLGSS